MSNAISKEFGFGNSTPASGGVVPAGTEIICLLDNTHGPEDLKDIKLYYLRFKTGNTYLRDLAPHLRKGDPVLKAILPAGTDVSAFWVLWDGGGFYRPTLGGVGDGSVLFKEIGCKWKTENILGINVAVTSAYGNY